MAADAGAKCFEVVYDVPKFPPGYDQRALGKLRKLLVSHDLDVSVHSTFWDLNPASHYEEIWKLTLKQTKRNIDACYKLGGELIVLHPGRCPVPEVKPFLESAKKRYLRFLDECLKHAHELGVTLALENVGWVTWLYSTLEELKPFVSRMDGMGIALDIGHDYLSRVREGVKNPERSIADAIVDIRKQLVHVHIHDNHGQRDEHLIPGKGNIRFKPIINALKKANYSKLMVTELWYPKNPIETAREGIKILEKMFR